MVSMSRSKHRGSRKQYYGEIKLVDKYLNRVDQAARDYERTKDEKYKKLWYDLVRKFDSGSNYIIRRRLQSRAGHKADASERTTGN